MWREGREPVLTLRLMTVVRRKVGMVYTFTASHVVTRSRPDEQSDTWRIALTR